MNASEARRAALTAAVAWCRTPDGMELSTDAMLAYAAQFETWLTRPASVDTEHEEGDAGVASSTHQPWTSLWPTPTRVRPNPYCTVCEHSPHAGPTCTECACTGRQVCRCTDHWHVHGSAPGLGCTVCTCETPVKAPSTARVHGDVARVDACVCTFRSSHVACSSCGHDAHDPGDCASTHAYTAPEPVVTLPDPIVDAPCTGFRAGMADSSYGCAHARMAHGPRGCSVTGCRCERAEGPRVVHDPVVDACRNCGHSVSVHGSPGCTEGRGHMDSGWERACTCPYTAVDLGKSETPEPNTCPCTVETVHANCPGCGHGRHESGQCARGPVVIR